MLFTQFLPQHWVQPLTRGGVASLIWLGGWLQYPYCISANGEPSWAKSVSIPWHTCTSLI